MIKFLRYNGKHVLFIPRGYNGKWLPQLNPMASCSHAPGGKPTFYLYEPRWLYRLRQRLFKYAGKAMCGGRFPAHWHRGPDGFRTCSGCGSLHYDDFMKIVRLALKDERYSVEGSTKRYKIYVKQPGVRNAGQGAIKFYTDHLPEFQISQEDQDDYKKAMELSRARFEKQMTEHRQGKNG